MDYYGLMLRFPRFFLLVIFVFSFAAIAQGTDNKPLTPITSALDSQLFYQLLLGELNAREGEPGTGFALLLDAARKTNDPKLYQRATDIALRARSGESALLAARAWRQALPASREANRYLLQILISLNRISETLEPLKREIAATNPDDRAATIAALPSLFARASDKNLAANQVAQALAGYLSAPKMGVSAWTTIGRMRFEARDINGAVDAANQAQALAPQSEDPVLLALFMMNAKIPQAESIVKKYFTGPAQPEIRMVYARTLLSAQRYAEASAQLQVITSEKPDYADAWLIRGILELEANTPSVAERSLLQYVDLTLAHRTIEPTTEASQGLIQAYLALAQIAEQNKKYAEALAWLLRIDKADQQLNVQLRRAALLARQDKLAEAIQLIHDQPENSPEESRLKIMAEVQLLRDNKQYPSAYKVLAAAIAHDPDDVNLLYDMAMIAEKMGRLEEMEQLLRSVIASKPDYVQAYNALGYLLAERSTRLPEAKQLILKALEITPDDPFIQDSLGWVEFRSGHLEEARRILQGAFNTKPDAEIGAHLGEVLWTMGQQEQAKHIWAEVRKMNHENKTLMETLKRLRVPL